MIFSPAANVVGTPEWDWDQACERSGERFGISQVTISMKPLIIGSYMMEMQTTPHPPRMPPSVFPG